MSERRTHLARDGRGLTACGLVARWLATWGALAAFLAIFAGGLAIGLEGDAAAVLAFFPAAAIEGIIIARKRKDRAV